MTLDHFSRLAAVGATVALASCVDSPTTPPPDQATIDALTITAQPGQPSQGASTAFTYFGLADPRDGWMFVPTTYDPGTPAPLLVLLHGAGGSNQDWASPLVQQMAEENETIVVAIDSRYPTWDVMQTGRFDVDVAFLNDALEFVFARVNVNPERITIGGFSDGATEALGIGVANAGLFRRVIAFSPGAMFTPFSRGFPAVFVAHGTDDEVNPYGTTANTLVPRMIGLGMAVNFVGFSGGHTVPPEILQQAFAWMLE